MLGDDIFISLREGILPVPEEIRALLNELDVAGFCGRRL